MAPGRAILQGIDAKPVNLIFEFTIFGSPKSNSKRAGQYTLPPNRQSTAAGTPPNERISVVLHFDF